MDKRYHIQFFKSSHQTTMHSSNNVLTTIQNQGEHLTPHGVSPQLNNSSGHQLPKLALPIFNRNPLKWQTFWDLYHSGVHNLFVQHSDIQLFKSASV